MLHDSVSIHVKASQYLLMIGQNILWASETAFLMLTCILIKCSTCVFVHFSWPLGIKVSHAIHIDFVMSI